MAKGATNTEQPEQLDDPAALVATVLDVSRLESGRVDVDLRPVDLPAVVEKFGGRYLVRGGAHEVLEGDWRPTRLVVLEFAMPSAPVIGQAYRWYFTQVLPRVGRLVSGHTAAYSYLPASVGAFPPPAAFMAILEQAGFTEVRADSLTFGIVYLYTARKR